MHVNVFWNANDLFISKVRSSLQGDSYENVENKKKGVFNAATTSGMGLIKFRE